MNIKKLLIAKWKRILPLIAIFLLLVIVAIPQVIPKAIQTNTLKTVSAAGITDYALTGTNDNVIFQLALNDLPITGGTLQVVSTGAIDWADGVTVTRAIDNVVIQGAGIGTLFDGDNVTPIFTAGGDYWTFKDFATDDGGIAVGATTGWTQEKILLGAIYYAYRTQGDLVVSSTTSPIQGELSYYDGADWAWLATGADGRVLTTHGVGANPTWEVVVGGGGDFAPIVVAADSATAHEKAIATASGGAICNGVADEVEINAAITAVNAANGGVVLLSGGTFSCADTVLPLANVMLLGQGDATILDFSARSILVNNVSNVELGNFKVTGTITATTQYPDETAAVLVCSRIDDMSNVYVHDVTCYQVSHNAFMVASQLVTVSEVIFDRCRALETDGFGFINATSDNVLSWVKRITYNDCYAYKCGYAATRTTDWVCGFDALEWGNGEDIVYVACKAEMCWECGFYVEGQPSRSFRKNGFVWIDCVSINNAQKPVPLFGAGFIFVTGLEDNPSATYIGCRSYGNYRDLHFDTNDTTTTAKITVDNFIGIGSTQDGIYIPGWQVGEISITNTRIQSSGRYAFYPSGVTNLYTHNLSLISPTGNAGTGSYIEDCDNIKLHIIASGASAAREVFISQCGDTEISGEIRTTGPKALDVLATTENDVRIIDFDTYGATNRGIEASGNDITIHGGADYSSTTGLYVWSCNDMTISDRRFIGSTDRPMLFAEGGVVRATVRDCTWEGCANDPYHVSNPDVTYWNCLDKNGRLYQPSMDMLSELYVARATYNFAEHGGAISTIGLGIYLPDNAVVTRAWYDVLTAPTSGTMTATISINITTDDVAGILAATLVSDAAWTVLGYHEAIQTGTVANFSNKTTASRQISTTIATEVLTAGKFIVFCEYMVSD